MGWPPHCCLLFSLQKISRASEEESRWVRQFVGTYERVRDGADVGAHAHTKEVRGDAEIDVFGDESGELSC